MLSIRQLAKTYATAEGTVRAIQALDLDVGEGQFLSLLGPSGCGKTTTLRSIAGLERPDAGAIRIGGTLVEDVDAGVHVPAHQRDIGMVFQSYAVWPHLDVFENVAYPLQVRRPRPSKREIADRVMESLALVGMDALVRRPTPTLSGGQQQRVALARAIVRRPRLLLLDEPLSNLDARLREQMQQEIGDLIRRLGVSTLAVTHDQAEAMAMADRVAILVDGRLVQSDTPDALHARPASGVVASFLGRILLSGAVADVHAHEGVVVLEDGAGRLRLPLPAGCAVGDRLDVALRGDEVEVHTNESSGVENVLAGQLERVTLLGAARQGHVRLASVLVKVMLDPASRARVGDRVWLRVDPVRSLVFRRETP